ncbi:MAG: type III pantothenate kinase [Candidatus Kryptoniota bacterium]
MLLCIDVGNTHTVFGVYRGSRLYRDYRVASEIARTEDEIGIVIVSLLRNDRIDPGRIMSVGISSVVPNLTDILRRMSAKYFNCEPMVVSASLDLGIKIDYEDPHAVGSDRICNAVAGFEKFGGPLIIIDFGTATTFDVISVDGTYLGGAIAPGLETAAQDLQRRAAKLPKIELKFPANIIGKNTVASMQSGIMFGAVESMEGIVRRIKNEIGESAKVVATGGYAGILASASRIINAVEPSLVLEGVRIIYEKNQKKRK